VSGDEVELSIIGKPTLHLDASIASTTENSIPGADSEKWSGVK
jgi:hypothetical protein